MAAGVVVMGAALGVSAADDSALGAAARGWAEDRVWDDGQAEVAQYQAERVIYGAARPHRATLIVVKEDLATDLHVKADRTEERDVVTVLKLNWQAQIPTPNYDYHYLTSVFVRRADLRQVVKLSSSSQEWCGTSFQLLQGWQQPPRLETHSYFDGEGDRTFELELAPGDLIEDQLPLTLRALPFAAGWELAVRLLDSRRAIRAPAPRWRDALIRVAERERVPAGALGELEAWRVELARGSELDRYWFEAAYPNRLLRLETAAGARLELVAVARRVYWKLPGR
ncbi:MAG TPA: hypothetical protein VGB99_16145 [Acidobacteriota bacterium]